MGPRMAQALKNQENSVLFIIVYAKIKKTQIQVIQVDPILTFPFKA